MKLLKNPKESKALATTILTIISKDSKLNLKLSHKILKIV